jgi:folate-binding protein YgfZ
MGGTMLSEAYRREGVPLIDRFGVDYPAYFADPVAEYRAVVEGAGIIDLTHWRAFRLTGRDRVSFLQAMVTNNITALATNQGCHSLITTIKGKIIAELFVFAREEDTLVFVSQGNAGEAYEVLRKHVITEDVTVEDVSSQYGVLAVEGPKVEDILWRIFATGPFPKAPLHAMAREFEKVDIYLTKNSVTGEDGCHMMIPARFVRRLRDFLVQAARGSDGLPVGALAWNMRRVENGLPWFGVDFTEDTLPDEVGLQSAISYTKGCFHGGETLSRIHHRGQVNRLLVGFTVGDDDVPAALSSLAERFEEEARDVGEAELTPESASVADALDLRESYGSNAELFASRNPSASDRPVGWVTSVAFSPRLKKPLVLGHVRRETASAKSDVYLSAGTRLTPVDLPLP